MKLFRAIVLLSLLDLLVNQTTASHHHHKTAKPVKAYAAEDSSVDDYVAQVRGSMCLPNVTCGSDGKSCKTDCEFRVAQCKDTDLKEVESDKCEVLATASVIRYVKDTVDAKLEAWKDQLGADAPSSTIVPSVLKSKALKLEGSSLEIRGPVYRTFVWIPELKAVVDGVLMVSNIHTFVAERKRQTPESRAEWIRGLEQIQALKPSIIISGHALPGDLTDDEAPAFTAAYFREFEAQIPLARNSTDLIAAMKEKYPGFQDESSLELSAQVIKGERKW
ncbi:hypothetical protein DYB28_002166 [Aphanomyces astaci]|uniref:Metallo-beta-lactamase domain-containing protein n=1 Tax=Aphanomyces astaci TaxID=112090 RepID=A0A397A3U8_APHAT|nr:hypothetical protein DYB36_005706 [Aphanomyces astaci]RHZ33774.1 hypothetical protein DYB31_012448 [Aphanomyces astaci]RLN99546.1 hypothetical protein DYB28_002166 [Aphanomyces astaci]